MNPGNPKAEWTTKVVDVNDRLVSIKFEDGKWSDAIPDITADHIVTRHNSALSLVTEKYEEELKDLKE